MLKFLAYVRSILFTPFGVVHTIVMSVTVVFCALGLQSRKAVQWCVRNWSWPLLKPAGVIVDVRGAEHVHKSAKGFLLLFNHTSLLDIPLLFYHFPRRFMFGAKIELFKVPFFGRAMQVCGVLPIDRGNRNKVMKIYEAAIARVEKGECFALAPEGTRQEGELKKLGRFKRGPFEFALNAQMDIVPVIVAGAYKVLPKHTFFVNFGVWKQKVILQILPPISTSAYTMETVEQLQEDVRSQMESVYDRLNQELG